MPATRPPRSSARTPRSAQREALALRRSRELQRAVPVTPQPRAADAADRHPGLCVEPFGTRHRLGRRLSSSASWRRSRQSRRDSVAWSTICSTSPRSTSGLMRMQFDWCELDLVLDAAIACLPDEWRGRGHGRRPPTMPGDLGRPRPSRAGVREPAQQRPPPQPARNAGHRRRPRSTRRSDRGRCQRRRRRLRAGVAALPVRLDRAATVAHGRRGPWGCRSPAGSCWRTAARSS